MEFIILIYKFSRGALCIMHHVERFIFAKREKYNSDLFAYSPSFFPSSSSLHFAINANFLLGEICTEFSFFNAIGRCKQVDTVGIKNTHPRL